MHTAGATIERCFCRINKKTRKNILKGTHSQVESHADSLQSHQGINIERHFSMATSDNKTVL